MSDNEFRTVLDALSRAPAAAPPDLPPVQQVTVVGAGPIGLLLACECLAAGLHVRLYSVSGAELAALDAAGGITVRGAHLVGSYRVAEASQHRSHIQLCASLDAAVDGSDLVMVATPSRAHATLAGLLAGCLTNGQTVLLVPGRFLGAVAFTAALRRNLCTVGIVVAELDTAPYLASSDGARVRTHALAKAVRLAALPVAGAAELTRRLAPVLPALTPADSPLETAFGTCTGVLGVAPLLTNATLVEGHKPGTLLLKSLIPHGLARTLLRALDEERRLVGKQFGVHDLLTIGDWLVATYGEANEPSTGDLADVLEGLEAFDDVYAAGPDGPLVQDDVPHTLVPLASAGAAAGVPTPATDAVVALASQMLGSDFMREGATLERLGLADIRPADMRRHLAAISEPPSALSIWKSM